MKLHLLFFKLLVVLIPSQLAFHFWPNWSFIFGRRIDYLSPTVYVTDLLIFATIGLWILYLLKNGKSKINKPVFHKRPVLIFLATLFFVLLNSAVSQLPFFVLYKWSRVFEIGALIFYIHHNKHDITKDISLVISIALLWTSILALMQFLGSGAVGGLWYWFGERSFTENTPGIALQVIQGQSYLRPYATLPHPNALAGGLLILISITILHLRSISIKFFSKIVIGISFGVFLLARSESAFIALFLSLSLVMLPKSLSIFRLLLIYGFVSLLMLSYAPTLPREQFALSLSERILLLTNAGSVISQNPLLGVGLGTSVLAAPRVLIQPVHNVFILLWQEIGSVGLILIAFGFHQCRNQISSAKTFLFFVATIATTGLFDHYWLTLQQPLLLISLVVGLYGFNDQPISFGGHKTNFFVEVSNPTRRKRKAIHSSIK